MKLNVLFDVKSNIVNIHNIKCVKREGKIPHDSLFR